MESASTWSYVIMASHYIGLLQVRNDIVKVGQGGHLGAVAWHLLPPDRRSSHCGREAHKDTSCEDKEVG